MEIIGHTAVKNFLISVPIAHFPQTLLFVGPRSVGKTTLAHTACARLLEITPEAAATHPQVIHLTAGSDPKTGAPRAAISVSMIRELRGLFALHQSAPRIILIERAEELNAESSNALLKIMEEPTRQLFFMILAQSIESVLPTIVSRAACVHMSQVGRDELRAGLFTRGVSYEGGAQGKFSLEDVEEALKLAENRPGVAIRFLENPEFKTRVRLERTRFERVRAARAMWQIEPLLADLFAKKERHIEARADLAEMLEWWLVWLRVEAPQHPALTIIAATIPRLFENMHPRLLLERVVIELLS